MKCCSARLKSRIKSRLRCLGVRLEGAPSRKNRARWTYVDVESKPKDTNIIIAQRHLHTNANDEMQLSLTLILRLRQVRQPVLVRRLICFCCCTVVRPPATLICGEMA